jgi:hypothetical protein
LFGLHTQFAVTHLLSCCAEAVFGIVRAHGVCALGWHIYAANMLHLLVFKLF